MQGCKPHTSVTSGNRRSLRHLAALGMAVGVVAALSSCNREEPERQGQSWRTGFRMTEEGTLGLDSGVTFRKDYERRMEKSLRDAMKQMSDEYWIAEVEIEGDPRILVDDGTGWNTTTQNRSRHTPIGYVNSKEDGWRWKKADVSVTLVGVKEGISPPLSAELVKDFVVNESMGPRMTDPDNLTVQVFAAVRPELSREVLPDDTVTGWGDAPVAPKPDPEAPKVEMFDYTVQKGDTLADISTVFYGNPGGWRRILEANPGLEPEDVKPGIVLKVPKE